MEKFLLLVRADVEKLKLIDEKERFKNWPDMSPWVKSLVDKGKYIAGQPLALTGHHVSKGKVLSDGPFIESKESVIGYNVILAENMQEAIRVAETCPMVVAGVASREVRPVLDTKDRVQQTFFAPEITLKNVAAGVDFYKKVFNAIVLRTFDNDDGSIHVAEMEISGALFHLHEETKNQISAETLKGSTTLLGIFVDDPDGIMARAVQAGAKVLSTVQDYDYGYRQGRFADPFGNDWMVEKRI